MTAALFVVAAVLAVGDWFAVRERFFRIEYVLKPLSMVALIAAAASADIAGEVKPWLLGALAFGLIGDIALMLSPQESGRVDGAFLGGVGAFLAGHVAFVVAFGRYGLDATQLLAGALIVVVIAAFTLPKVLLNLRRIGGDELMAAVGVYALALGAMATLAVGTASILTAVGGVLFLVSDTILARDRFVKPVRHAPLLIIVTYHLAQFLLVLGLARTLI